METERQIETVERQLGEHKLRMETGRIARQAHGAVTVRYGDTVVLGTVLSAPSTRDIDFFPLYVDYREFQYAGGKFPGGFFKREGRPTAKEILTMRMIDRPIRPLFPSDFQDEVQIQCMVISFDPEYDPDVLGVIGGSASLALSHAPFQGPIGCVRVGRVDGEFVLFPSFSQREQSDMDLIVAGHSGNINMIELGGRQVPEDVVAEGCRVGFEAVQQICDMIAELAGKVGVEKGYEESGVPQELADLVAEKCADEIRRIKTGTDEKTERGEAVSALRDRLIEELIPADSEEEPRFDLADIKKAFYKLEGKVQRQMILDGQRPDGRKMDEIRPLHLESPFLPRTHGSALFSRGQTQSMATVTLGTPRDQQKIDGLQEEYFKRFLLHYNFPPFSVGEIRPIRGPSRRDIGHGGLAERSIEPVIPSADDFPYTIRVVSEILESNGSSSMASVCSATMALLDAGVPLAAPVAGISIGMVWEDDRKVLLTDIIGEEDFHGDMDFKVAGTREGITGIQVDMKRKEGIDHDSIVEALQRAREARLTILDRIGEILPTPRSELSTYAPRLVTLHIDPEKIGKVIGPGGKTINAMQDKYEVTIDIEDDGTIFVGGTDAEGVRGAVADIEAMTEEIKLGATYTGKVVNIRDFGAFFEIAPGQDGLCHVSELSDEYVKDVKDVVNMGDEMELKVIAIDDQGRVKLSRKAVIMEARGEEYEPQQAPSRGGRGGGRGRGGRDGGRGGRGGRGGGGGRERS